MKSLAMQMWREDEGVLTFEWILLLTVLTIGIVSGLSTVRDAMISELTDVAQAMVALDQSYFIDFPIRSSVCQPDGTSASDSEYRDKYARSCDPRADIIRDQNAVTDCCPGDDQSD